ncbi:MAG TPA: SMP-30/gluconolactonase/LRE family protein [Acidobacteriaceae bacterium]|nr:SMP-30/gluconolactonase/LRE family protein [Acidobacteriaceae bacterium]
MRYRRLLPFYLTLALAVILAAGAHAQPAPQTTPALAACGTTHGNVEILCGTHAPEDLEPTPDGKYLIVAQFEHADSMGKGHGIALFDIAAKTFIPMPVTVAPHADWGSPSCPGPMGDGLVAHGISLTKRTGGLLELYVINHNRRESMEMFEVKHEGAGWALVWHGCVVSPKEYNDVAALPDGGFLASHPTALMTDLKDDLLRYSGKPIGYVVRWTRSGGEQELPGTRVGYPNGILASPDGRFMYLDAWTAREVHQYDLKQSRDMRAVPVQFMPDNISWIDPKLNRGIKTPLILAAGVKGAENNQCPAGSGHLCAQQFGVAEIDARTMKTRLVYESPADDPLIAGASVAVEVGNSIYIGAYQGDRLLKINLKK